MKRFYKLVSSHAEQDGFSIQLDGKPVKTLSGKMLRAPSRAIADALTGEWAAQVDKIVPDSMPLTQILTTRIDRVSAERATISQQVLNYLDTDLLCYRAEHPPEVAQIQAEKWDPWLVWFEKRFGVYLQITVDLAALRQDKKAHKVVKKYVEALDDDHFTILQLVTSLSGSLVLALAFVEKEITAQEVFDAAYVEEQHKAALYNEDFYGAEPMQEKKQKTLLRDLKAASDYLNLLNA